MRHRAIVILISAIGIILSVFQFLFNRNLWLDEAKIGQNIIEKSYVQLLEPLHSNQVAPILFLWIEKFFVDVIGNVEYGLRLFPLIAYLLSIYLVYKVSQLATKNATISIVALSLFCISPWLLYYSSEVKQYSVDVMVALLLYYVLLKSYSSINKKHIILTVVGFLCIFLSNISVIILFTMGIYAILYELKKEKKWLFTLLIWALTFTIYYLLFIYNHPTRVAMNTHWEYAFMPKNPFSLEFWLWLFYAAKAVFILIFRFENTLGAYLIIAILYIAGMAGVLFKKSYRLFFLISAPIILHLALSYLKLYPFDVRVILYQLPLYFIAISYGLYITIKYIKTHTNFKWLWLAYALPFLVIGKSLLRTYPFKHEEVKPIFNYVMQHIENEDTVYVYHSHEDAFLFYSKIGYLKINNSNIIFGKPYSEDFTKHQKSLNELKGRVWVLISHDYIDMDKMSPQAEYIVDYLKSKGTLLTDVHATLSSAYLIKIEDETF